MQAILTVFPQRNAGITLIKTGNLTARFRDGQRVMIRDVPAVLAGMPSGEIPSSGQRLAGDEGLAGFFADDRVIKRAGGSDALARWVSRIAGCQCEDGDHVENMTTARTMQGYAVRLCHACDNRHYMKGYRELAEVAARNRAEWLMDFIRMNLGLGEDHQVSIPELFCWAVLNDVADAVPVEIVRRIRRLPEEELPGGTMKEADIDPWQISADTLVKKLTDKVKPVGNAPVAHIVRTEKQAEQEKPVLKLVADCDPAAGYMRRPKMQRLSLPDYTAWVKRQRCCGCGKPADDPHHITGHGFGGAGIKGHDLFVIPLCRECHQALHNDRKAWEEKNGSQLLWVLKTLDRAAGIGALVGG
ncbi:DUF968 domain-containing protein [Escherichia coli]|uniref:DUF968 domain-containing protein n=1 Tax=Escherichia coli TaxID=562 RepID=UPI0005A738E9|nr:DUF968 domain-containing protein [Escherichia coli]EFA9655626.1 DUF968 domain-containing protein [Escherichia coli]EFB3017592.1 DUF968 domain-containing protein [Escherichia coli]EFI0265602.1 DUF968 domain-containing protein [Escherichia coli]EFQ5434517.1 DUF968 domain-containing protein [Escherichia coli]EGS5914717.1 DUF968 domain-containing protein [Escherichia coli]